MAFVFTAWWNLLGLGLWVGCLATVIWSVWDARKEYVTYETYTKEAVYNEAV